MPSARRSSTITDQPPSTAEGLARDRPRLVGQEVDGGLGDLVRVQHLAGQRLLARGVVEDVGSSAARRAMGVAVSDGATRLTRIRSGRYVAAMVVISAVSAPFAAAYACVPNSSGTGAVVVTLPISRIEPRVPPVVRGPGRASLATTRAQARIWVRRFRSAVASHASGRHGVDRPSPNRRPLPPATEKKPSIRPKRCDGRRHRGVDRGFGGQVGGGPGRQRHVSATPRRGRRSAEMTNVAPLRRARGPQSRRRCRSTR